MQSLTFAPASLRSSKLLLSTRPPSQPGVSSGNRCLSSAWRPRFWGCSSPAGGRASTGWRWGSRPGQLTGRWAGEAGAERGVHVKGQGRGKRDWEKTNLRARRGGGEGEQSAEVSHALGCLPPSCPVPLLPAAQLTLSVPLDTPHVSSATATLFWQSETSPPASGGRWA